MHTGETSRNTGLSHPKYRPDIDGLRAIAVLSVVGFHSFPNWIRGGFIGVDIFFVISGYLISTIIFENLERGTFSFAEFYARRVRRIFPALWVVLAACFAFGWFVLLPDEYQQLGKHVAAGAGFVSNLVLWNESGYFDNAADTKPLLHLWSLGIEEQYYIVWPLLAWAAWKRKVGFLSMTVVVLMASFILNIREVHEDTVAAFYSPMTRFWELLTGSLLAWFALHRREDLGKLNSRQRNLLSLSGVGVLGLGLVLITKESAFPGWWALLPVLGVVLVILAGPQAWLNRSVLGNPIAVWFGLISYPLYLWHWPLLVYPKITTGELTTPTQRAMLISIAILLAWATYYFIGSSWKRVGRS
ncbi:MAG: acyltransferase [Steroidobacteraceae bacterium]